MPVAERGFRNKGKKVEETAQRTSRFEKHEEKRVVREEKVQKSPQSWGQRKGLPGG